MNEETRDGSLDTDAQLMLRFQAGDLRAFESLFWRHSRPLVNFAYRFVRSRETAEELAQEVFLRVHDAAPLYRAQAKFTTWLYRIATNVCLNRGRRSSFRQTLVAMRYSHVVNFACARYSGAASCTLRNTSCASSSAVSRLRTNL